MKVYEAIFEDGVNEGVYALSVVENPAMEDFWVAFSKHPEKIEFAQVDTEKRLLLGAALIPEKRIPRIDKHGNEFEMFLSAPTIEKLAQSFLKNQKNNNSSLEHQLQLDGMSVVESWTVEDSSTDKSALYGKQYPKGTWVAMMKVNNDEVWEKVKNGEVKGFSIDAMLGLEQVKFNKSNINQMTEEVKKSIVTEVIDGVKALFSAKEEDTTENIEVQSEEVVEEVKDEFDKEAFMAEVIETVKTEFSAQAAKELETVKVEFEKQINDLTEQNKELKAELNKEPEVESVKLSQSDDVQVVKMTGKTITERVFSAING